MQKNWTQTKKPAFDRKGAVQMNEIAQTIFAPIYPVIARQALDITRINRGLCLDIGSGPAMLAIAVARKAPDLNVVWLPLIFPTTHWQSPPRISSPPILKTGSAPEKAMSIICRLLTAMSI